MKMLSDIQIEKNFTMFSHLTEADFAMIKFKRDGALFLSLSPEKQEAVLLQKSEMTKIMNYSLKLYDRLFIYAYRDEVVDEVVVVDETKDFIDQVFAVIERKKASSLRLTPAEKGYKTFFFLHDYHIHISTNV